MARTDRLVGMLRSLVIYHGVPRRQRRLRRLYGGFVSSGDLVFDLGAHVGNRARALAALGCRVVAVEPQPDFARLLRTMWRSSPDVVVVEAAVTESTGRAQLSVSERTPTVSTVADRWRAHRGVESGFEDVRWNRGIDVETVTLDALIARFGVPSFAKLDVEGSEPAVLAGLSQPVATISFEYLPHARADAEACLTRLAALGDYRYNWSPGESYRLAVREWITGEELLAALWNTTQAPSGSGDIYARRV